MDQVECNSGSNIIIVQLFSESDERAAWGRFEIKSMITLWTERHEVQLVIHHINN